MGRPKKIKPEVEKEEIVIPPRPKPIIDDPRFGYSRPAPKPSSKKK